MFGEKYAKDKKNPTQVEVQSTQDISPDKNFPKKLNGAYSFSPHLWILLLNPLKIYP